MEHYLPAALALIGAAALGFLFHQSRKRAFLVLIAYYIASAAYQLTVGHVARGVEIALMALSGVLVVTALWLTVKDWQQLRRARPQ